MKLIALNIVVLVLVPLCVLSNSNCTHSDFVTQRFEYMENKALKKFFESSVKGIKDSDCMLFYNVTLGPNKFYPYHFELRERKLHIYGMLNVHVNTVKHVFHGRNGTTSKNITEYSYTWNRVSSLLFDQYYDKCSKVKNSDGSGLPNQLVC